MKMLKGIFVLVLIGLILSGTDYSNQKIFALSETGGGFGGGEAGGGGGAAGGAAGAAGTIGIALAVAEAAAIMADALSGGGGCGMGGGPNAFGGRIQKTCKCVKTPGVIVKVGSPKGGNFYFGPGSKVFLFGKIIPGVWSLGTAGSVMTCLDPISLVVGKPIPMSGSWVKLIGTSLF